MRLLYQPFDQKRRPPLMKFYCGIDLSARDCHVCVIDAQLKIMVQQKLRNDLARVCQVLAPYKANLKIVVESTFNWYWLVDGLQAEGFDVVLAHTLGLYLITGTRAVSLPVPSTSSHSMRHSTTGSYWLHGQLACLFGQVTSR